MKNLYLAAILVLILNLPFGFWRAGVKKLGLRWFLAVHLPIPFVVTLRFLLGLGWQLVTFPVLVGAYLAGQFFGGKLRSWQR